MSEVVWSVNIMVAILLIAVGYVIYWVFMFDTWYPNPLNSTLMEYKDGSDETPKSEELLQLSSDGNQQGA